MSNDARIMTSLPAHPKTRKLIRRHGQAAAWNLICLFLFARDNKPDGDFAGMDAEDVELAADWQGAPGEFVATLIDVGFLDEVEGGYMVHGWTEHNPWAAGSKGRSESAKQNAAKRWAKRYGTDATGINPQCDPHESALPPAETGNAPSPIPYPTPTPTPTPTPKAKKQKRPLALTRFADFWNSYPRRADKAKAEAAWSKHELDAIADAVIAGALAYAKSKQGSEAQFIALPTTWLNGKRWNDDYGVKVEASRPAFTKQEPETPEQAAIRKRYENEAFKRSLANFGVSA